MGRSRSRSPEYRRSISRSPRRRSRTSSPTRSRSVSPKHRRNRSRSPRWRASANQKHSRSPNRGNRYSRSPSPRRRHSPMEGRRGWRDRSPRNRSRSPLKHRSRSPFRRRDKRHRSDSEDSELERDRRRWKKESKEYKKRREEELRKEKEIRRALKKKIAEEKALRKLVETPEERRERRLKKKELKKQKQAEDSMICGYTNEANPFGDSNLTQKFVWGKKADRDESLGKKQDVLSREEEKRRREMKVIEIEKLKLKREQRQKEKILWEEEKARLQRREDMLSHEEWKKQEEQFHLEQARLRSKIRMEEGRARPIDVVSQSLTGAVGDNQEFLVELSEPHEIFKNLTLDELEELEQDVQMHQELDKADKDRSDFWSCMMVVCHDELSRARAKAGIEASENVKESDIKRVDSMLAGKNLEALSKLEMDIKNSIDSGKVAVDVEFMDYALQRLTIAKAKARLADIHERILMTKLEQLEKMEKEKAEEAKRAAREREASESEGSVASDNENREKKRRRVDRGAVEADEAESPRRRAVSPSSSARAEDLAPMEGKPEVLSESKEGVTPQLPPKPDSLLTLDEQKFMSEAAKASATGGGEGDLAFNIPVPLQDEVYHWADKFRPRPPKFFNRVLTGFEWNKYNQTHYDHDTPPPKVVQGYKFNIFYPDLIDKTKIPTYRVEPTESPDIVLIRFHAGPPYEDIAFKIVNREWEYGHRRGFKCKFERGVLQLYFHFKRIFYRR